MALYSEKKHPYLETDALDILLDASLLQVSNGMWFPRNEAPNYTALWPIAFASKSLRSAEIHNSNIEREALSILHGLADFHHNCFAHEVDIITDHKLLVTIFKKDVTSLSQRLQRIPL